MNNMLVGVLIKNTHLEANTDKRMQSINCANYSLYLTWQSPEFDIWLAIGKKKKKGKMERRKGTTNTLFMKGNYFNKKIPIDD